jgi:O-antigen/teichoic acid export membrane protein
MTRNLLYSTIANGSALLLLALAALAARYLGPAAFGDFSFAISLATIAETFMDFGLHQITIRTIARDHTQAARLFYTSLALKALPGAAMVLVFSGLAVFMRPEPAVRLACVLMLGSAVMRSYLLTARGVLQGLNRFKQDALVTVLDRAGLVVACGWALHAGAGLVVISVVFLVARAVTTAAALLLTRAHVGPSSFDSRLWASLPAEALPVGVFLLVLNVYNRIDTVMLGWLSDTVQTGLYGTAYPLYEGATYAAAVLSAVLTPRLSRQWSIDRRGYGRDVRGSLLASAALAVAVALAGWVLAAFGIRLIFGPDYDAAVPAVRLLLVGLPCIYAIWVLHAVAISAFETAVLVRVTALGTIVNVALNVWLIRAHGANGAAVATVISETFVLGLLVRALRRAIWPVER